MGACVRVGHSVAGRRFPLLVVLPYRDHRDTVVPAVRAGGLMTDGHALVVGVLIRHTADDEQLGLVPAFRREGPRGVGQGHHPAHADHGRDGHVMAGLGGQPLRLEGALRQLRRPAKPS